MTVLSTSPADAEYESWFAPESQIDSMCRESLAQLAYEIKRMGGREHREIRLVFKAMKEKYPTPEQKPQGLRSNAILKALLGYSKEYEYRTSNLRGV